MIFAADLGAIFEGAIFKTLQYLEIKKHIFQVQVTGFSWKPAPAAVHLYKRRGAHVAPFGRAPDRRSRGHRKDSSPSVMPIFLSLSLLRPFSNFICCLSSDCINMSLERETMTHGILANR